MTLYDALELKDSAHIDTLSLFSVASTHYVVGIYSEIQSALEASGVCVKHTGLATDLWFAGNAYTAYQESDICPVHIERQTGRATAWWHDLSTPNEFADNMNRIRSQVVNLIQLHRPDVFLIDEDQNPIVCFLIGVFKQYGVPVLMFEHGYGFALLRLRLLASPIARMKSKLYMGYLAISESRRRSISIVPEVRPFGQNGSDMICCLSQWTRDAHLHTGLTPQKMIVTGNPYFDRHVHGVNMHTEKTRTGGRTRVLIVSTGHSKFGSLTEFEGFMDSVVLLCKTLALDLEVTLRLKPGEESTAWEKSHYKQVLVDLGVKLDDNSVPFYEAVAAHDVAICDPTTMAVLESILCRVPVISLGSVQTSDNESLWFATVYHKHLQVINLTDLQQARQTITKSLDSAYIDNLCNNLQSKAGYSLGPFDGQAGVRVAQVILDLVRYRLSTGRRLSASTLAARPRLSDHV